MCPYFGSASEHKQPDEIRENVVAKKWPPSGTGLITRTDQF